jgi:hypothetical protein
MWRPKVGNGLVLAGNVNPNMVLAFGIVGIIFDIVALIAYFMPDRIWRRTKIDEKNELVGLSGDELSMFSAVHSYCILLPLRLFPEMLLAARARAAM